MSVSLSVEARSMLSACVFTDQIPLHLHNNFNSVANFKGIFKDC